MTSPSQRGSLAPQIEEIKDRLSILDVVGQKVRLRKSGRNFSGLCPFHTEKTPSFYVFPDEGSYHCFGCQAHGDILTFVMKTEGLDFMETVRQLAGRAGVQLPEPREPQPGDATRDKLRQINADAATYWHNLLRNSKETEVVQSLEYLTQRGVTAETIEQFQIGYAPDRWEDLITHMAKRNYSHQDLLDAGLVSERESGGVYDRFRRRIIFPIRDARGNINGFGGRIMGEGNPKYLNSPQTLVFDKSAVVYGIDLARQAIRLADQAVIVEGYMDVVIAHQCGRKNVVASLGTAMNERQLLALKKITKRLVLALDPDTAGDEAALRGLEVAKQVYDQKVVPVPVAPTGFGLRGLIRYEYKLDADIRVMRLPEGLDPDELLLKDPKQWDSLVEQAQPVVDYFFMLVMSQTDLRDPKSKSHAVERLLPIIRELEDRVQISHYIQRLAQLVQVDERLLVSRLSGIRSAPPPRQSTPPPARPEPATPAPSQLDLPPAPEQTQRRMSGPDRTQHEREEYCLAILLSNPLLQSRAFAGDPVTRLEEDCFEVAELRELFSALKRYIAESPIFDLTGFGATLDPLLATEADRLARTTRAQIAQIREELAKPDLTDDRRIVLEKHLLEAEKKLDQEYLSAELDQCIFFLKREYLSRQIQQNRFVIRDAENEGNQAEVARLLRAQITLQQQLDLLFKNYKRFRGTHV